MGILLLVRRVAFPVPNDRGGYDLLEGPAAHEVEDDEEDDLLARDMWLKPEDAGVEVDPDTLECEPPLVAPTQRDVSRRDLPDPGSRSDIQNINGADITTAQTVAGEGEADTSGETPTTEGVDDPDRETNEVVGPNGTVMEVDETPTNGEEVEETSSEDAPETATYATDEGGIAESYEDDRDYQQVVREVRSGLYDDRLDALESSEERRDHVSQRVLDAVESRRGEN